MLGLGAFSLAGLAGLEGRSFAGAPSATLGTSTLLDDMVTRSEVEEKKRWDGGVVDAATVEGQNTLFHSPPTAGGVESLCQASGAMLARHIFGSESTTCLHHLGHSHLHGVV